jgi:cytochrome d ubiquinol oxidase subunit II
VSPLQNFAALLVLIGLIMYSAFAGADFGGGIWTALASGPRAEEQRESLFQAIGPVWETNHVWLIFVLVVLFTAFPAGFAQLFIALLVPLVLALVGINFRGASFVFRHFGKYKGTELPATELVFSIASILTPFFMGLAVAAAGAGRIQIIDGVVQGGFFSEWVTPFTIIGGLIGLAICAYITPFYMMVRSTGELREDFRKRAIAGAVALGILTTLEIPIAWLSARDFFEGLLRPAPLLLVALAIAAGSTTLILLWKRSPRLAQLSADLTVALTITGFASAMYPYMLIGELTFAQASAPEPTLRTVMLTFPFGAAILAPSLVFLYRTFGRAPANNNEK